MNAGVLLGGIIFGIGFGWAGNCPGTALAGLPHTIKVKTFGVYCRRFSWCINFFFEL